MCATIFDAGIGKLVPVSMTRPERGGGTRLWRWTYVEGAQLCIWILVVDALLERAHGLLGLDSLGANDIGDLEVEGDIFPT